MPEFDSEAAGFRVASESISPVRRDFETPWLLTPHQGRKVPIAGGILTPRGVVGPVVQCRIMGGLLMRVVSTQLVLSITYVQKVSDNVDCVQLAINNLSRKGQCAS